MGASFSKSSSSGQQQSGSNVRFPLEFLGPFSNVFGQGVGLNELLGALPQSQGLFGANQVGIYPTAPGGGGGQYAAPGQQQGPQQPPPGAQGMGLGGGRPGGAPQQPGGGQPFSYGDITGFVNQYRPDDPRVGRNILQRLNTDMQQLGIAPGSALTLDQIQQIGALQTARHAGDKGSEGADPYTTFLNATLPGLLQQYGSLQSGAPRFGASGSQGGINALGGYQSLGFGQLPPNAQAGLPNIRDLPQLRAPQAYSAQANIAPQGFEQFGQDLYQQQFQPVERQIQRQGALQDRALQDQLANSGLASSGAGVGIQQRQVSERNQQLQAASTDAANNASTQRFGLQYQQELNNAQMRQQTALANAGFDLQAQQANADNVLKGDLAKSDNYLKAYGLTQDAANNARTSFLQALGLQESDLGRQDQFQQQTLGLLLNNWLQQFGAVTQAGQTQKGRATNQAQSISQSAGISG